MRKHLRFQVLLVLYILILSGCSGANRPATSIRVTMTDFTFLPNTLTVPAGEEITLAVTNSGAVAHDLMIMKLGQDITSHGHVGEADHANAFWEQDLLEPGESRTSTFTAPGEPGEYQIVCGVAGHVEAGMVAKLIVVQAQ